VLFEREREGSAGHLFQSGVWRTSAPGRLYRSTASHGRSSDSALSNRLRGGQRELCETTVGLVVDHLGNLANLNKLRMTDKPRERTRGPRRSKTVIICRRYDEDIPAGGQSRSTQIRSNPLNSCKATMCNHRDAQCAT
jgi:hypothetical protein